MQDATGAAALLEERQWQLDSMQLVNFGPFDGHHEFKFETGSDPIPTTVISGASGTGKSTLQDAFFEVMTRNGSYNTASNEGGRGASLSSEKRSLIGYVRGKLEDVEDEAGNTTAQLLRDGSCNRWSCVVVTFLASDSTLFSVVKLFWIAAGYNTNSDVKQLRMTMFSRFDPRVLSSIADVNFTAERVRRVIGPSFKAYTRVDEFLAYVYSTLKVDERQTGRGKEVMDLLGRIRSGANFRSIAELFREQVLDIPSTYRCANEAAASYHKHREAYERMLDKQRRVDALTGIRDVNDNLHDTRANALLHHAAVSDEVFETWQCLAKRDMALRFAGELEKRAEHFRVEIDAMEGELAQAESTRDALEGQLAASGFAEKLALLDSTLHRAEDRCMAVRAQRASLQKEVEPHFGNMPETAAEFEALAKSVQDFLESYEAELSITESELQTAMKARMRLDDEAADVRADLDYYGASGTRIPRSLGEARRALSQASGIPERELPFAAELMDVTDEKWRRAAESVYGGFARTLLVDADDFERFSESIDRLKLEKRVNFRKVQCGLAPSSAPRKGYLSEVLDIDESSPFSGWLADAVRDGGRDALRVASPHELKGPGRRVTIAGQTRDGAKGAHGLDKGAEGIIGFDNSQKIDELVARLAQLSNELSDANARERAAGAARDTILQKRGSAQRISGFDFASVDLAGALAEKDRADAARKAFLAENEHVERLREELAQAKARVSTLTRQLGAKEDSLVKTTERLDGLRAEIASLDAQTNAQDAIISASDAYALLVNASAPHFEEHGLEDNLNAFDNVAATVRNRLRNDASKLDELADQLRDRLTKRLVSYQGEWPDTHLGTEEASVGDYLALLEKLLAEGFHEQKESWYSHMLEWIKEDLIPLDVEWRNSRSDIDDKLEPINAILQTLPFGRDEGRLEIVCRDSLPKDARDFEASLRELLDYERAGEEIGEDAYHRKAQRLMAILEPDQSHGEGARRRNEVLDRRRHVKLTARVVDPRFPDKPKATYNALASKSGGEVAEIVAFILGAALLYRLGRDGASKPGFAPVLLDEGFIKADAQFTARAIAAWQGFGFQLIIAAPEEKFQSVVARAQGVIHIVIDDTRRSYVAQLTFADEGMQPKEERLIEQPNE